MSFFNNNTATRTRSDLWYILPVFGGILGGLISWFAIRYDDPRKARNCLLLGIALTTVPITLIIIQFVMFSTTEPITIRIDDPYNPPIVWVD